MKRVELVFFDAGGGHRSAANALCEIVTRQAIPWDMRMMNLQELLDEMDVFRKITGIRLEDIYNLLLRKGWTLGSPTMVTCMHAVIKLLHPQQVKLLARFWGEQTPQPDMVVSVIPNFNRALHASITRAMTGVPMVTILTDMADYPPNFWIERQSQYFICGTDRARQQGLEMGHPPDRVFQTSGMILHPRFYEPVATDRPRDRAALGLNPDFPTALMMFGGEGSPAMLGIARDLDADSSAGGMKMQMIAICGKNKKLEAALRALKTRMPIHVVGFTREVPRFMRLSDFFIGKPGPGSISEAVAMGLPVIIERNNWTLPQERYNADWVTEQGVGIALRSFRKEITGAAAQMLEPARHSAFVERVKQQNNQAIFEIPQILAAILARGA